MDNYLGDNYEKLTEEKTRGILSRYCHLMIESERGNITALCLKIDIETALQTLTPEEYICVLEHLIRGNAYYNISKALKISHGTARNRVKGAVEKITEHLKHGGKK